MILIRPFFCFFFICCVIVRWTFAKDILWRQKKILSIYFVLYTKHTDNVRKKVVECWWLLIFFCAILLLFRFFLRRPVRPPTYMHTIHMYINKHICTYVKFCVILHVLLRVVCICTQCTLIYNGIILWWCAFVSREFLKWIMRILRAEHTRMCGVP